jgi:hypothetical protein
LIQLEKFAGLRTPSAERDELLESIVIDPDLRLMIGSLNAEDLRHEIGEAARAFDDLLEAWRGPDASTALASMGERIKGGEYGVVAQGVVPKNSQGSYDSRQRCLEGLEEIKGLLRERIGKTEKSSAAGVRGAGAE